MKKIYIIILVVLLSIAIMPIVGNKIAQDKLNESITLLESKGIEIKKSLSDSGYLKTTKHYKILLKDSKVFLDYLGSTSNPQYSNFSKIYLDGASIGIDLTYSNFPFASTLKIDIYILSFSEEIMSLLEKNEKEFYTKLNKFLKDKKMFYHIKYDLSTNKFNGFMKDIDANFILKDNSSITYISSDINFEGEGNLLNPNNIKLNAKEILLRLSGKDGEFEFSLKNFLSTRSLKSKNSFESSVSIDDLSMRLNSTLRKEISVNMSKIRTELSSSYKNTKLELSMQNSFDNFSIKSKNLNAELSNFNNDLVLKNINKAKYEKLIQILSTVKSNYKTNKAQVEDSILEFIASGLIIDMKDISVKSLILNNEKFDGFSIRSRIDIKKDNDFRYKMNNDKEALLKNIDLNSSIKISKSIFNQISKDAPIVLFTKSYAKEEQENLVYNILFSNTLLEINGKKIEP